MSDEVTPTLARKIIRGLTRGTVIQDGARHIHVGHTMWIRAQEELLDEVAEDGQADTKFVRGAYGAGKSHFLSVVQDKARFTGWATAHLECKADHIEIDRFETLYPAIVRKLRFPSNGEVDEGDLDAARRLFEAWSAQLRRKAGIRDDGISRPFDADERLYKRLSESLHRTSLPSDFIQAATAFARAELDGDQDTLITVSRWFRGEADTATLPLKYVRKSNTLAGGTCRLARIGRGNSVEAMRALLWLVRAAGHAGLVLCIDEVEELAKLRLKKRQDQSLQALREFVDHAGGHGGFHNLCIYLAATPEMFESPDYFPRYDALATRIQAVSDKTNWRAPVIDLDKHPLSAGEMRKVAERIIQIHEFAYPDSAHLNGEYLDSILDQVQQSRFRIARPRLLARVVVDELERARQEGENFMPTDAAGTVAAAAASVAKEQE